MRGAAVHRPGRLLDDAQGARDARLRHLVRHEVDPEPRAAFPAGAQAHGRGDLHGVIASQVEPQGDPLAGARRHQAAHERAVHTERAGGRLQDLGSEREPDGHDVGTAGHSRTVGAASQTLSLSRGSR